MFRTLPLFNAVYALFPEAAPMPGGGAARVLHPEPGFNTNHIWQVLKAISPIQQIFRA